MKEVFEKIINYIHSEIARTTSFAEHETLINVKFFVHELEEKHNNGWISVDDELPNVTRCRVTVQYDMEDGKPIYDTMDATFSRFGAFGSEYRFEDSWRNDITNNVIAWQPLPAPYKKGE